MVDEPLLSVDTVTKDFQGLRAVDHVKFDITQGELVGLIGPNGAGKTTLFNCIAGTLRPTSGSIRLEGSRISGLPPAKIARRGLVRTYQNLRVFPDITVFDNVCTGAIGKHGVSVFGALFPWLSNQRSNAIAEDTLEALARFDLLELADAPAGNLAYGQKKLLEVARAMALGPKLLLLDEPAAGLNIDETAELSERIWRLRDEGVTILLVEHDMPLVMRICERIIVLDSGVKIADGVPAAVRDDPGVRQAYLGEDL